jgi:hypothetical protein
MSLLDEFGERTMATSRQIATDYHEASHAVTALWRGIGLREKKGGSDSLNTTGFSILFLGKSPPVSASFRLPSS